MSNGESKLSNPSRTDREIELFRNSDKLEEYDA